LSRDTDLVGSNFIRIWQPGTELRLGSEGEFIAYQDRGYISSVRVEDFEILTSIKVDPGKTKEAFINIE